MNTIDLTPLVQAFLPRSLYPKAKAVVAGVLTVLNLLGTVLPLLADAPTWIPVVVAGTVTVLTPVLVYLTGNEKADPTDAQHDGDEAGATPVEDAIDKNRYGTL